MYRLDEMNGSNEMSNIQQVEWELTVADFGLARPDGNSENGSNVNQEEQKHHTGVNTFSLGKSSGCTEPSEEKKLDKLLENQIEQLQEKQKKQADYEKLFQRKGEQCCCAVLNMNKPSCKNDNVYKFIKKDYATKNAIQKFAKHVRDLLSPSHKCIAHGIFNDKKKNNSFENAIACCASQTSKMTRKGKGLGKAKNSKNKTIDVIREMVDYCFDHPEVQDAVTELVNNPGDIVDNQIRLLAQEECKFNAKYAICHDFLKRLFSYMEYSVKKELQCPSCDVNETHHPLLTKIYTAANFAAMKKLSTK